MSAHLLLEVIKNGAELHEGVEDLHKHHDPDAQTKGLLEFSAGAAGAGGLIMHGAGAALNAAGAAGAGGAALGAAGVLANAGHIGAAGLAGYLFGHWLDEKLHMSDNLAGVTPAQLDKRYRQRNGVEHQITRGARGIDDAEAAQKANNPTVYYAEQTRREMVKARQAELHAHMAK